MPTRKGGARALTLPCGPGLPTLHVESSKRQGRRIGANAASGGWQQGSETDREGIRMQRRTQATRRSVSRMKRRSAPGGPRVAALDVRARQALGDRPLMAIGAAVALGWVLGRAFGARR